jgi:hypothetical protein
MITLKGVHCTKIKLSFINNNLIYKKQIKKIPSCIYLILSLIVQNQNHSGRNQLYEVLFASHCFQIIVYFNGMIFFKAKDKKKLVY